MGDHTGESQGWSLDLGQVILSKEDMPWGDAGSGGISVVSVPD